MRSSLRFFIQEISDLLRYCLKTKNSSKEIVIYSEHKGYYQYYEGIIDSLINTHKQEICYITSDPHDPILSPPSVLIHSFYIKSLLPFFMLFLKCKVCIMTMPDLDNFHIKRSVNDVHYVYVFHALLSTHLAYLYGALDHYDTILCCGPHHVEEIRKHEKICGLKPKNLVKAGYNKLEQVYSFYKKQTCCTSNDIILLAPSWGEANILETCGEQLVALLLQSGYEVILRPHPETIKRTPKVVSAYTERFGGNNNFTLERSIVSFESIFKASVLITDYSGLAFEYAFGTERPVIYLDVPPKIKNKKFNHLNIEPLDYKLRSKIGVCIAPDKITEVPTAIAKLINEQDDYKKRIIGFREKYVFAFGSSSAVSAQAVMDITQEKQSAHSCD